VVAAIDPVGPVFWADMRLEEDLAALMPPFTMSSSWLGERGWVRGRERNGEGWLGRDRMGERGRFGGKCTEEVLSRERERQRGVN
jgi:hypothetical protein